MTSLQHPRPGKCFQAIKSIYINKQAKPRSKIEKVLFTDTVEGKNGTPTVTSTNNHAYNLRTRSTKNGAQPAHQHRNVTVLSLLNFCPFFSCAFPKVLNYQQ